MENDEIGVLQDDGVTVISDTVGQTKVVLVDSNVKASGNVKQPSANFHVVNPGYLIIEIEPGNKPSMIVGKPGAFHVHLHDDNNNRIFLSDTIAIKTVVPKEYFTSEDVRPNGTFVAGIPRKEGKMTVVATLSEYMLRQEVVPISPPLKATLNVQIYAPLSVTPKLTLLPWNDITKPQHRRQLVASGGSGHVLWQTNASDIATVNANGLVTTTTLGEVLVTATMAENSANRDSAVIVVKEVLGLKLVEGFREFVIDETLVIGIAALVENTKDAEVFSACEMLPYKVSELNPDFSALQEIRAMELEGSCASLDLIAQSPGFSNVLVSYKMSESEDLQASTTVGAFKPLAVVKPSSGSLVLALGTGYVVHFEGGPLPWIHKPSGHYSKFSVEDKDLVRSQLDISSKETGSYRVYVECMQLGETRVTLTVGNTPSSTLPNPMNSTATATVTCAHPEAVQLGLLGEELYPCPMKQRGAAVASCEGPVALKVTVTDGKGAKLDNVSSLNFAWSAEQGNALAELPAEGLLKADSDGLAYGVLIPKGTPGDMSVSVTLMREGISASLALRLVPPPSLSPRHLVLYHHPSSQGYLSITGGSGYFELLPDGPVDKSLFPSIVMSKIPHDIAAVEYLVSNTTVRAVAKNLGSRVVTIRDLCVVADPPSAAVTVAIPESAALSVAPLVEQGSSVEAILYLLSSSGYRVPILPTFMQFTVTTKEDLVSLEYLKISDDGGAIYKVNGLIVGETALRGSVTDLIARKDGNRDSRMVSSYEPVQVFSPLRLRPKYITLVVGGQYQVRASGGPVSSVLQFLSSNSSVGEVDENSGVVSALQVGNTTVSVSARLPSSSSERLMRCQDVVIVRVVTLRSVEISAPTQYLEAGTAMPIHVTAFALNTSSYADQILATSVSTLTPLNFASAEPPLVFRWSNSDASVAGLDHVLSSNKVQSSSVNFAAGIIRALKPGVTTVSVSVSVVRPAASIATAQIEDDATLTATFMLTVFEPLALVAPQGTAVRLLLSPGARYQLETNRDRESNVHFNPSCDPPKPATPTKESSDLRVVKSDNESLVTINANSMVLAGNVTGTTSVIVEAEENFGSVVQHSIVLVEVREVCYVMATADPIFPVASEDTDKLPNLPVGSSLPVHVTYHDCTGRTFDALANSDVTIISNRDDLIVQKSSATSTVALRVRDAGQTVLAVSLPLSNTRDLSHYFRIPSGYAVTPHKDCVAVGEPVCLTSSISGIGKWGGDGNVEMSPTLRHALPLSPGSANVHYTLGSGDSKQTLKGKITVRPIQQLELMKPEEFISDGAAGDSVTVPLQLSADCDASSMAVDSCWPALPSAALLHHLSCSLQLDPPPSPEQASHIDHVFLATPVYSEGTGYGCAVQVADDQVAWLREHWTLHPTSAILLTSSITAMGPYQPALSSAPLPLPLLPGVQLNGSTTIALGADTTADESVVFVGPPLALSKLQAESNSSSVSVRVEATPVASEGLAAVKLVVGVVGSLSAGDIVAITLTSPLTRQTFVTLVGLESSIESICLAPSLPIPQLILATLSHYHTHLFALLCVVLTAAAAAVGYQAWCGPGYRNTTAGVFVNSPPPKPAPQPQSFSPYVPQGSPRDLNISLWSTDSVYGAPPSPPSLQRSPRRPL